jgi:integral membrane protein (TIGR01906 family)
MPPSPRLLTWLATLARVLLLLAVPLLLVAISVRAVMFPAVMAALYQREGFPADFYGMTTAERLQYAPLAVDYLLTDAPIAALGDLRFPNGAPLFNDAELRHMVDVKIVLQATLAAGFVAAGVIAAIGVAAWRGGHMRLWWGNILGGALLTVGVIATIVLLAVTSWDMFFTQFHTVFFPPGTWQFLYSDTLIRLFPEQFWFEMALIVGGLIVGGAALLGGVAWVQLARNTTA